MSCNFLKCVYFCIFLHFGDERSEGECMIRVLHSTVSPVTFPSVCVRACACVFMCVWERAWMRTFAWMRVCECLGTCRHYCYHCNCQLCEAELLWKWKVLFLIFKTVRSVRFRGMENKLQKPLKSFGVHSLKQPCKPTHHSTSVKLKSSLIDTLNHKSFLFIWNLSIIIYGHTLF